MGAEICAPAAWSARGLISVRSAPVSSIRIASALPLILTSTMIRWPGGNLIVVVPVAAFASPLDGPGAGAFRRPSGTAVAR